jgi:predicted type IV restriction endonuclease
MSEIKKSLKKLLPYLLQAKENRLNEADTVNRLIKVFETVLGYDGMTDISSEAQMKGKYVDMVLKVDGVVRLLVEAKAAGEKLKPSHIDQAQGYASRNNYRWVLLTNGIQWNLYHLTFEEGIEYEVAFAIDLADESKLDSNVKKLSYLHKSAVKKNELEAYWENATALDAASVGRALCQHEVLIAIRKEVRKKKGILVDPTDLLEAIHGMLSPEAREKVGPMQMKKKPVKKAPTKDAADAQGSNAAEVTQVSGEVDVDADEETVVSVLSGPELEAAQGPDQPTAKAD